MWVCLVQQPFEFAVAQRTIERAADQPAVRLLSGMHNADEALHDRLAGHLDFEHRLGLDRHYRRYSCNVDGHRSTCLVVSPYTKRKQVISRFYNRTSVLHRMERIPKTLALAPVLPLPPSA